MSGPSNAAWESTPKRRNQCFSQIEEKSHNLNCLPLKEHLEISVKEKYLGQILDKKLNWKLNVNKRARKATIAFNACNHIFGKSWEANRKIIFGCMYTAIVRPILT